MMKLKNRKPVVGATGQIKTKSKQSFNMNKYSIEMFKFTSGYRITHTDSNGTLSTVTYSEILQMAVNPPSVEKMEAQWAIFNDAMTRSHSNAREHGNYAALWLDIDENNLGMDAFIERIKPVFQCEYLVYLSRSATEENEKLRLIVPLLAPVDGMTWIALQKILLNKICNEEDFLPDETVARAGQLCFLPNRGKHYRYVRNTGSYFDSESWSGELAEQARLDYEAELAKQEAKKRAQKKRIERLNSGQGSLIDEFNANHSVESLLERYGYERKGNRYKSPNSQSSIAGVFLKDERWISHHDSDSDIGVNSEHCTSGDAFDLFVNYEHSGDRNSALSAIRPDLDSSINFEKLSSSEVVKDDRQDKEPFSLTGKSNLVEQHMTLDEFLLEPLALVGQLTVFYAAPNTGKTLITIHLLREAVINQRVKGENIFYINADDSINGFFHKLKILEQCGINVITPDDPTNTTNFKVGEFTNYVLNMCNDGTAKDTIIVLDTLKKFADLMDKKRATQFNQVMGSFASHGGTVIGLAHVNKHKDDEGKSVKAGTSDMEDDWHCTYIIDELSNNGSTKTVQFKRGKSRGSNQDAVSFQYSLSETNYQALLNSVQKLDCEQSTINKNKQAIEDKLNKNDDIIQAIIQTIKEGIALKTELVKATHEAVKDLGISKNKVTSVLEDHTGRNFDDGHRWHYKLGENNAKLYALTKPCIDWDSLKAS